ncbi:MAG TPA: nucleotide exchange factor GrpE [Bacillota bacterium]|nr:nucleotide exchange factor GrpE [Bacillota bacterium]HPF42519.1 nucleotide exchange factor GrpE [Bacillota bacterium]HPJ85993.1 nucleotide exchange factor GrpE [Bacillota bacterium]HPQ61986.1 nucleotide exchange factor GrpE [Bacillota bacterium]
MDENDKEKELPEVEEKQPEETTFGKDTKEPKDGKKKKNMEAELEKAKDDLEEMSGKYLRTLAEMENLKKRLTDEMVRDRKYATMNVADKLIDHLEVFDQALSMKTEDLNFKNFLLGFRMIKDSIFQVLSDEGVKQNNTVVGNNFDPNLEHAIDKRYEADKPEGVILEVVKKGYMFKDRLLRPALVVINVRPEIKEDKESEEIETNDECVA